MIATNIEDPELRAALDAMGVMPTSEPEMLRGGANNRVYRVATNDGDVVVKRYFRHAEDERDRLAAEFVFLRFARRVGLQCVPEAMACSAAHGAACYSLLPGRPLAAEELEASHVRQAAAFVDALQTAARSGSPVDLPDASEACFRIEGHLKCVDRRVDLLRGIGADDERSRRVARFVSERLGPVWQEVREHVNEQLRTVAGMDRVLAVVDRCVSPSDFGFHNALCDGDGKVGFIDFEYAGWDDPAKLVCDFFCQPRVPVPLTYLQAWMDMASSWMREPELTAARVELLLPVYRVKWCCIMLNVFLARGRAQRQFAANEIAASTSPDVLDERLIAAEEMLSRIDEGKSVIHELSDSTSLAVPAVLPISQSVKSSRRRV